MNQSKKGLRTLALALGLAWLAVGCVRLSEEPDYFSCNSDADCESDQRCLYPGARCIDKNFCTFTSDCAPNHHCTDLRCKPDECTPFNADSVCNGYSCYGGVCETSCSRLGTCADGFHCEQSVCLPGAPLDNGQACTQNGQCSSGKCCAKPSGSVCTDTCAAIDERCMLGQDCASGICCKRPGGASACSAVSCAAVPECISDDDCGLQICVNQKCVPESVPKGAGEACTSGTECASGTCAGNVCRGTATQGDACTLDVDCEAQRPCCVNLSGFGDAKICGELDRGCPGSIGASCEFDSDCIDDLCIGDSSGFCSKPCTSSAQCGKSPWGVANACETNGLGDRICFPGCSSSQQCWDNLASDLECYDALDSSARICAAQ